MMDFSHAMQLANIFKHIDSWAALVADAKAVRHVLKAFVTLEITKTLSFRIMTVFSVKESKFRIVQTLPWYCSYRNEIVNHITMCYFYVS